MFAAEVEVFLNRNNMLIEIISSLDQPFSTFRISNAAELFYVCIHQ